VNAEFDPHHAQQLTPDRPDSPLDLIDSSLLPAGRLEIESIPAFSNPLGNVHGGIALYLSDLLAGDSADSTPGLQTASVHITYVRPIVGDTKARFSTKVVHRGRSLGVAYVVSETLDGKACTLATITSH
jgi:uncharacterized protein (TIGR00369 family)